MPDVHESVLHDAHHYDKHDKVSRWFFGGLASAGAACCTHPLDLLKVLLQTQQTGQMTLGKLAVKVVREDGVRGLYNGISASLVRQLTYSTTRFGMYESLKHQFSPDPHNPPPFVEKVAFAAVSGGCGGVVGTPGDMVNVRMQNDMKIEKHLRRNYKHALDGMYRVYCEEGVRGLFNGCTMATVRAMFMTVGQLSMYDQFKQMLIHSGYFDDNILTHFTASSLASGVATTITQPLDVLKTRMMNAKPGEFKGIMDCVMFTAKTGPMAFYKGYIPALVRLAPQTILTFIFLEQLRMNLGYFPKDRK